jgi:hypothetical protein
VLAIPALAITRSGDSSAAIPHLATLRLDAAPRDTHIPGRFAIVWRLGDRLTLRAAPFCALA